ncbi:hypothetical protein BKA67DRAFT_535290 [Truncatella angustata]|uniref:Uncharacterized protein n=1 Tax=Truncatella angustata TaxID=152316 RepID=A0A9P8ZXB9_9PEZI|nr:uncharacterized protein BKA67DRAFT_535290 [Truncatella angustata]KAH6653943.1 hypothetical protein BKA67DRAFT_535290 [Truncatella angustata]
MLWYDKPIPRHFKKHDHDGDIDLAQYEHDEAHKDKHINDGIVDASGDLALKPVAYHGNSRIFNELLLIGNNNKKYLCVVLPFCLPYGQQQRRRATAGWHSKDIGYFFPNTEATYGNGDYFAIGADTKYRSGYAFCGSVRDNVGDNELRSSRVSTVVPADTHSLFFTVIDYDICFGAASHQTRLRTQSVIFSYIVPFLFPVMRP